VLYTSIAAGYRIEARFAMGSRTPNISNIGSFFQLSSIESGEAYEVRIHLVDTTSSGGTSGGGGMTMPGPGGTWGATCQQGPDIPWSFGRGRIDPADENAVPSVGPWEGWIPAPQLYDMIGNLLPSQCPSSRGAVRTDYTMNRAAIIASFEAFMANPQEDAFDPAFEAVSLGKAKLAGKQWLETLASETQLVAQEFDAEAQQAAQEIEAIEDQMADIPCAAPPDQIAADRCKALEQRVAHLEAEVLRLSAKADEGEAHSENAADHAKQIETIQIWQAWLGQICGATADVSRTILQYKLSKNAPSFMWYAIMANAGVSSLCLTMSMRAAAMNPSPLSSAFVYASMLRASTMFGIDSVMLYREMRAGQDSTCLEPVTSASCRAAIFATYFYAWRMAGAILVGGLLLNRVYDKAIAPNLPW
jgi:hypothetical protein